MNQEISMAVGNYLEALAALGATPNDLVRPIDLATYLGVSKPTVCSAVSTLKRKGFAEQPYRGGITLTQAGYDLGCKIRQQHAVARAFLSDVLHLDKDQTTAQSDILKFAIDEETLPAWETLISSEKQ